MRIGVDIRTLMDARYSGVSEYAYNILDNILDLDTANQYSLFYNSFKDISERIPDFSGRCDQILKLSYPNKVLNYLLFLGLNSPKIDQKLGVDLFFMPHINFIGLSPKIPFVLTVHDLSYLRYPEYFSGRKNFWHRLVNAKRLIGRASRIISMSENTKNDIIELCGINEDKISVIYSGIDPMFRVMQKESMSDRIKMEAVRKKYSLPDKYILFLGTIEPRKNLSSLISAYDELCSRGMNDDRKLVIAGMRGWKSQGVYTAWERSKYKENIIFTGYIDREDKTAVYNLSDLFIYPSFYEGFGFPPLEAMACGVPVVCSSVSSLSEVAGNSALTIDPHNAADITEAMKQTLVSQQLRQKLSQNGLDQVRQFNWQNSAEKHIEVFNKLAI